MQEEKTDALAHFSMYADTSLCKGCRKCELACIAAHNEGMTIKDAAKERKNLEPRVHVVKNGDRKMPIQCRHCEDAPCVKVCPTRAMTQNADGSIRILTEYCAGCGICVMTCPYGAVSLSNVKTSEVVLAGLDRREPRKIAVNCDLCREWRVREGKDTTACMETCSFGVFRLVSNKELHQALHDGTAVK